MTDEQHPALGKIEPAERLSLLANELVRANALLSTAIDAGDKEGARYAAGAALNVSATIIALAHEYAGLPPDTLKPAGPAIITTGRA